MTRTPLREARAHQLGSLRSQPNGRYAPSPHILKLFIYGFESHSCCETHYRCESVLKWIFVLRPETEPLHTNYRDPLPGTKYLLHPY